MPTVGRASVGEEDPLLSPALGAAGQGTAQQEARPEKAPSPLSGRGEVLRVVGGVGLEPTTSRV